MLPKIQGSRFEHEIVFKLKFQFYYTVLLRFNNYLKNVEIVEENPAVNKCLKKVADAMYSRLISEFHSTRVRDFSKNIKTLSAKYFYHEPLFSAFCRIVERDIDENCYCSKEHFKFIVKYLKTIDLGILRFAHGKNFLSHKITRCMSPSKIFHSSHPKIFAPKHAKRSIFVHWQMPSMPFPRSTLSTKIW